MSFVESDHAAIESRFESNWNDETPIAFENIDFDYTDEDNFVRLTIIDGESSQVSLEETPLHRRYGLIIIQIFVKKGKGTKRMEELAGMAATIFRSVSFNSITCRSASYNKIGEVGNWYQANVDIPFYVDEQF